MTLTFRNKFFFFFLIIVNSFHLFSQRDTNSSSDISPKCLKCGLTSLLNVYYIMKDDLMRKCPLASAEIYIWRHQNA